MPLKDKATGQNVVHYERDRSSEQMTQDYQSGNYEFTPDTERVNVFMPYQSGQRKMMNIRPDRVAEAIKDGWHIESARDQAAREWGESEEQNTLGAQAGIFGESLFNSLMMGAPELHQQLTGNPLESAKNEYMKREYGALDFAGGSVGTIANLLVTGGIGATLKTVASKGGTAAARKLLKDRAMALGKGVTEEVAGKAADSVLKKLGQSIGTSAVLGTAEMAPMSATEAIWGDPSKAGEYLMMGSLIGGGLGGALSLTGSAVKGAATLGAKAADSFGGSVVEKAAVKGLAGVTGAPEWAIKYNMANPGKVNNAVDLQQMTNKANRLKDNEVRIVTEARAVAKDSKEHMDVFEQQMTRDMNDAAKSADPAMADMMEEDIGVKLKEMLGLQSEQAEGILEFADVKIGKHVILNDINREIKRLTRPGITGDTNRATLRKLQGLKDDVDAISGTTLNGPETRRLLRSVREDAVFSREREAAGMFDKGYSKVAKTISGKLSGRLKKKVPEYGKKMDEMSPLAETIERMSKTFRSRSSRLDAARILSTPKQLLKKNDLAVREDLDFSLAAIRDNADPTIIERYGALTKDKARAHEYMDDHRKLFQTKSKNNKAAFRDKYHGDQAKEAQQAIDDLVDAEAAYKIMKPAIGSEGSEYMTVEKLRKMMAKEGDETMDNARNMFFERSGLKFDDVQASVVKDAFTKAKPAGSKYVNLGITGGFAGGWIGSLIGAVMGAGMENFGGKVAQGLTSGKLASWMTTEKLIGAMARKLDKIPKIIRNPGSGVARANIERMGVKLYRSVYMDMSDTERKEAGMTSTKATAENIDTREIKLNLWKGMTHRDEKFRSNPNAMMSEIENKTAAISGDENLAGGMVEHMIKANDYLSEVIPKDPMPESPFIEADEKWEPSDYDLDVYSQQTLATNDPLVIVDHLLDGTLTREMTDAVGATSPNILEHVQGKMAEAISEHPKSFDYSTRISASYIMGMELDPTSTPESYMYYQSAIVAEKQQEQEEQQKGNFAPDMNIDPSNLQTKVSKLEGGLRG